MTNRMCKPIAALLLAMGSLILTSPLWACYAIVVGKDASTNGAVLLGHNEQDWGTRILNFRKVPRRTFPAGAMVALSGGALVPQVRETYAFLWSGNPGLAFSDSYMNEWGVSVASDGCSDREDSVELLEARGDLTKGGISYLLRRLVVERARTARQGVEIAGELIGQVGYPSARTLVIADAREAWLLAMAKGKHWVAQRVPDDEVACLPNRFTIGEVDLKDTANFIAPPDLIDYAVRRGWYEPASGRPFRFWEAYDNPQGRLMDARQRRGQCLVTGEEIDREPDRQLPFSVRPSRKISVRDLGEFLRYRDGGDALDVPQTMESAVFELRDGMPPAIGCVYWRTTGQASTSVRTPWYACVERVPPIYHRDEPLDLQLSAEFHLADDPQKFEPQENNAWWIFKKLQDTIHAAPETHLAIAQEAWNAIETRNFDRQAEIEKHAAELYARSPEEAHAYLTDYCSKIAIEAIEKAKELQKDLEKEK